MARKPWISSDDAATLTAMRNLLRRMPADARAAVLADVERNADPRAAAVVRDIVRADEINGAGDWGDGLSDGHHPHLCGPQCPGRTGGAR